MVMDFVFRNDMMQAKQFAQEICEMKKKSVQKNKKEKN